MHRSVKLFGLAMFPLFWGIAYGALEVHPDNPRYFRDGSGKLIYLTGAHTWGTFQDIGNTYPPPQFNYDNYLNLLEGWNHNFIRMWVFEGFGFDLAGYESKYVYPPIYERPGPGTALDGRPKYDLDQLNQYFFDRLRDRVINARDRGIYVSVMLFQGWSVGSGPDPSGRWIGHPCNAANNINGVDGDTNHDGVGSEIHTLSSTVLAYQEAYVRKLVSTLDSLENVIWEIGNEMLSSSKNFQYHMIDYIRSQDSMNRMVGMTSCYGGTNPDIFSSSADWVSPRSQAGYDYTNNPPAADGSKVILIDTDHIWGIGGSITWVWKCFTRGLQPLFMDKKTPIPGYEPTRKSMGDTRAFANKMNLVDMIPRGDLTSTGYALANPGVEYLVYQPGSGSFNVNLAAGTYDVEWFNPNNRTYHDGGTVTAGGGIKSFTPPFSGDAVLYLIVDGEVVDTLVGLWHFDKGSGTTAYDSSGYGNDGTIHGANWTGGIKGQALEFDGTNDYVKTASSPTLMLTDEITLEAWAYLESSTAGWQMIISREHGTSYYDEFALCLNPDDHACFWIRDNTDQYSALDDVALSTGFWHHLVGTYNGSVAKLYVDGVEEGSNSSPNGNIDAGTHPVVIGAGSNDNGASYNADPWNGIIDEARIYSRALSAAEIKEHYDSYQVTLSFPNGGEDWIGTHQISWSTIRTALDSYRLLYSTDGGTSYPNTIASNISADSISWDWTVPAISCTTVKVKVQMLDAGSAVISEDESDSCFTIKGIGAEEEAASLPEAYGFSQVYPNPSVKQATISYRLPAKSKVSLRIYDMGGRLVRTLVDEEERAGFHEVVWDARSENGERVAAGIYFYRMEPLRANGKELKAVKGRFTVVE